MKNIESLTSLYKRDTKGKVRIWTIQYGYDSDDVAGTRTIAGLVDGQKVTSEWNMSVAKNVGKANGTTAKTQAISEAKSSWDQKADKEYFERLLKSLHKEKKTFEKFITVNEKCLLSS